MAGRPGRARQVRWEAAFSLRPPHRQARLIDWMYPGMAPMATTQIAHCGIGGVILIKAEQRSMLTGCLYEGHPSQSDSTASHKPADLTASKTLLVHGHVPQPLRRYLNENPHSLCQSQGQRLRQGLVKSP